jgi:putative Ca2+/H+ antiporter (TMEM165/GDT1 family)
LIAFWTALSLVFIAEMGDKTQLVSMLFATRYRATVVLAGVFVATLLVHLLSVFIGDTAGRALPAHWINVLAGVAFIIFGLWTLRGDKVDDDEDKIAKKEFGPFMTVATTLFLAELGDKTMLATVTIASQQRSFLAVWLGSTLGMVAADALAIVFGKVLGKQLPEQLTKYVAAAIFLICGVYTIAHEYMHS